MKEDVKTIVIVSTCVIQYSLVINRVHRYPGGIKFVSCVIAGCGSRKTNIGPNLQHITQ